MDVIKLDIKLRTIERAVQAGLDCHSNILPQKASPSLIRHVYLTQIS